VGWQASSWGGGRLFIGRPPTIFAVVRVSAVRASTQKLGVCRAFRLFALGPGWSCSPVWWGVGRTRDGLGAACLIIAFLRAGGCLCAAVAAGRIRAESNVWVVLWPSS